MDINTDINVLGSIVDLNIIIPLLNRERNAVSENSNAIYTAKVKTTKSLKRYESAIKSTLIHIKNEETAELFGAVFKKEGLSENCLALLFLNASANNDLLDYLNQNVYFPALFSGRIAVKKDEVVACINDLTQREEALKKWSASTINVTASKYLSLLTKFKLFEGGRDKHITHRHIDDKQFIVFLYWLSKAESKPNLLKSKLLAYGFSDKETFINRVLQKKFMKFVNVNYTGASMTLEPLLPYKDIYNELAKF